MKGQLETETLIAVFILTFFLLSFFVFYLAKREDISYINDYFDARKICFDLKNTIDSVYSSNNNSRISLTLPSKIGQEDYSISIEPENKAIRIIWDNYSYTCSILPNVTTTSNLVGELVVYNFNGNVIIQGS